MRIKTATAVSTIGLLWLAFSIATARTICVNPTGTGGCYSAIQSAINSASAGDTIPVSPGTYREHIVINKSIKVIAVGGPCEVNLSADTGWAIWFVAGATDAEIKGVTIESRDKGAIACEAPIRIFVLNCLIKNSALDGIYFSNGNGTLCAYNNVIFNNSRYGIYVPTGNFQIYSNIIYGSHSGGFERDYYSAGKNEYNCLYLNTPNYAGYAASGFGDIEQNPQFIDPANCDYHLAQGSPSFNSGREGSSFLDCDGTRNDMGIYGGPDAICDPGPVVTSLQLVPATVVKGEKFEIQATGAAR